MEALQLYHGSSSEEEEAPGTSASSAPRASASEILRQSLALAPRVSSALSEAKAARFVSTAPGAVMLDNPTVAEMYAPQQGPGITNPQAGGQLASVSVSDVAFADEFHSFHSKGYAAAPSGTAKSGAAYIVGSKMDGRGGASTLSTQAWGGGGGGGAGGGADGGEARRSKKRRRRGKQAAAVTDLEGSALQGSGIWGSCEFDAQAKARKAAVADRVAEISQAEEAVAVAKIEGRTDDDLDREEAFKYTRGEGPAVPWKSKVAAEDTTTTFHGTATHDYQGRPWTTPAADLRPSDGTHTCVIPKKCVHTYTGHTKGVQSIDLFPTTGHLILSGSMDTKIKVWDVYNERRCMRTYMGHNAAVRQVKYSDDGERFLSCSYDRRVKLWDTETGQCIGDYGNNKVPYCVTFYPVNNNVFLVGCSNKKVVQVSWFYLPLHFVRILLTI